MNKERRTQPSEFEEDQSFFEKVADLSESLDVSFRDALHRMTTMSGYYSEALNKTKSQSIHHLEQLAKEESEGRSDS